MSSRTISRLRSANGLPLSEALDLVAREDVEGEAELLGHFVLPLLDQRAGRDDEASLQIAPDQAVP